MALLQNGNVINMILFIELCYIQDRILVILSLGET